MVNTVSGARLNARQDGQGHGQEAEQQGEVGDVVGQIEVATHSQQVVTRQSSKQKGNTRHGKGANGQLGAHHVEGSCRNHQCSPPTSNASSLVVSSSVAGRRCRAMKAAMNASSMAMDWR